MYIYTYVLVKEKIDEAQELKQNFSSKKEKREKIKKNC